MARLHQPVKVISNDPKVGFPWLWILFGTSCSTLLLQLVPALWWPILVVLDFRDWTWRAYAVVSAATIVALVAIRAWQENSRGGG